GTVVIAPPNGDMRAYQTTLKRLRDDYADARTIYGGHGDKIEAPARKIEEYIAHRAARETELLRALEEREHTIPELVARIYRNVATALWPAAARQMLADAIALEREGRVASRILDREPTPQEAAILNPDLSQLVDAESVAVAAAELGIERRVSTVESYRLVS
ncbi:MAG: hypothetical protein IAI50_12595, partial [Candidatus Eremiobacteraeota bacterium]|nr:hypothetical protein [Candidatus Eremiobacteraeota bacterium]